MHIVYQQNPNGNTHARVEPLQTFTGERILTLTLPVQKILPKYPVTKSGQLTPMLWVRKKLSVENLEKTVLIMELIR